jgi:anaerobic dimethyl sulfoxide reductase subunit B (iron-sulfur subunit)
MYKQAAFYLDIASCSGCKTCMVACLDGHSLPADILLRRVIEVSGGSWVSAPDGSCAQDIFASYISISCNHCLKPPCVSHCPSGAMRKNPQGIVLIDQDKCVRCRTCESVCPYKAPRYYKEHARMTKCDFCFSRLQNGKKPLCVEACPMRALHFGEYEELRKLHGSKTVPCPLPDPALTKPCLVLSPARHQKYDSENNLGIISNPEEI